MECSYITVDKMQIAESKKSCSIRVRNTKRRHILLHRVEKWSSHLSNISYRYLKNLGYFHRIRTPDFCSTNYTKPGFYTLGIFKRQYCLNCPSKYKYLFSVLYTELKFKCINYIYTSYILIFFVLVCCLTSFWYLVNIAIAQF